MLRHEHWLLKAASQIGVFDTHVRDGEFAQIASTFVPPFEFFLPETFNSADVSLQPAGALFSNVVISFTPVKGGDIAYLT